MARSVRTARWGWLTATLASSHAASQNCSRWVQLQWWKLAKSSPISGYLPRSAVIHARKLECAARSGLGDQRGDAMRCITGHRRRIRSRSTPCSRFRRLCYGDGDYSPNPHPAGNRMGSNLCELAMPNWLHGAVDVHVHSAPSIYPRLYDDDQLV